MSGHQVAAPETESHVAQGRIVNDFSMVVATVNGSGSQTSNMAIIRALFRMGLRVSGKNLFPSNIQGLPTWFTIRVSSEGFVARRDTTEVLIAMNPATLVEDLRELAGNGVCFYPDDFERGLLGRTDVTYYPMPVQKLVREAAPSKELRDYIANMVYVGVVAQMLGIELDEIRHSLETHFQGKAKAVSMNMNVVEAAAAWAEVNLTKSDPYKVRRDQQTDGLILVDGNTAAALGAIYGGVSFAAWYPITPASSLAEALGEYLPQLRTDPETGRATYSIIQAEDELAAIGMAIGAGWAGARAMTSTSGPGISLMAEFSGLAFFAEVPIVVWDIQRMGPSTGLPTRTSQGDILFVRFLGHGDTRQVMLLPGSPAECFEFGWRGFDLAERLQTPVFILSDLDLGMNLWMSEPFTYPDEPMDRGKVLTAEDLDKVGSFARYRDIDGDGIPYRTLPGNRHPLSPYLARGTGHSEEAVYSERSDDWEANMERLMRKHDTAHSILPKPIVDLVEGAEIGLIGFGTTDPAIQEARQLLSARGIDPSYMRIRAVPFADEVKMFIDRHARVYMIEMNTDGQMRQLLQIGYPERAAGIRSIRRNNGLPLTARWIADSLLTAEEK